MYNTPDWQRIRATERGGAIGFTGKPAQFRVMMAALLWMYPHDYPVVGMLSNGNGILYKQGCWV